VRDETKDGLAYAMDERLAPHYERHLVEDCLYRTPDVVADVLARMCARGRWLDLGAGTGLVGKALARGRVGVELVALDVSPAMLDLIETPSYVSRHCVDAARGLPFEDGAFDGVVAAGLFEHVADPAAVFRHAARVVVPGGGFAFTFPPNAAGRTELFDVEEALVSHDVDDMRALLASCGFRATVSASFPAYKSGTKGWVTHHVLAGIRAPAEPP
jgi:SAM-dependent methyltransferase